MLFRYSKDILGSLFGGIYLDRSALPDSVTNVGTFGFTCALFRSGFLVLSGVFFALSALVALERGLAVKQQNGSIGETIRNTIVEYFYQPRWYLQLISDIFKIVLMLAFVFPFYWMIVTAFKTYPESLQVPPTLLSTQWTMEGYERDRKSVV